MQRILFFLMVVIIYSCVPKEEKTYKNIDLTLESKDVQSVISFGNAALLDSLYPYLSHEDPSLRYLAIKALSSQFDVNTKKYLYDLLKDPVLRNKSTAAFALGQTHDSEVASHLVRAFVSIDTVSSVNNIANRNILEAVGKTGDLSLLSFIGSVDYLPSDNELLLGQTRAIYQFSTRGIIDKNATDRMINYTIESHYSDDVRILASSYLARSTEVDVSSYKSRLLQRFLKEKNVFVKMNIASCLGRTKDREVLKVYLSEIKKDGDYRVKINMINQLGNFPYISIVEPILLRLTDKNIFVAQAAAKVLLNHGNKYDASIYQNYITKRNHYSLNADIISAVLNNLSPKSSRATRLSKKLINYIENASSTSEKLAYIKSLAYAPAQYRYALDQLELSKPPIKTAYVETLVGMYENTKSKYGKGAIAVQKGIFEGLKTEMNNLDIGVVATVAMMIANPQNELKTIVGDDKAWLATIKSKLKLPKGIEAYQEISKAIAYVNGTDYKREPVNYVHDIDWTVLEEVNDSTRVTIVTTQGTIMLELYPMHAPATVSNFVSLVKKAYYDDKTFHRVVPNFVIQTGCPRGDGYGGEDYVIHSELGDMYYNEEGYLGMASSGKNTESTQWFITERPTPHLDGKYTIFGKVLKGMDVVHKIKQGDMMKSVRMSSI